MKNITFDKVLKVHEVINQTILTMKKIYLSLLSLLVCVGLKAQVDVTFNVDMNDVDITTDSLHIAGNFNDPDQDGTVYPADYNAAYPNWSPNGILLTDEDADGVFTVVLSLNPARYEFKFINGNDWPYNESVPSACTVEVGGNSNRQMMVGTEATSYSVCYGKCVACGENAVRFRLDVSTIDLDIDGIFAEPGEDISPDGIHVAGDFQGWDPGASALQDWNNDNIWEATYSVGTATSVSFKYVNGNSWDFPNENMSGACSGGDGNRLEAITSDNNVLNVYCWNSCDPCTQPVAVTFSVDMNAACADLTPGMFLMGTVTDWANGAAMSDDDGDLIYTLTLNLAPTASAYEYKFRIGTGGWEGIGNRMITVSAGDPVVLPEVCFNSSEPCGATYAPADVTFECRPGAATIGTGESIWIMGNFTEPQWQPGSIQLTDGDGDGTWSVTVPQVCLTELFYKFAIGSAQGTFSLEETADFSSIGGCGVDNGTFSDNRILVRTSADPVTICWTFDTCDSCLEDNVEENTVVANLQVYPVPADEILNVYFNSPVSQKIAIRMVNTFGQVVLEENVGMVTGQRTIGLNTSAIAAGIYSLVISNGVSVQTRTISVK